MDDTCPLPHDNGKVTVELFTSRWSNPQLGQREDLVKVGTSVGKPKFRLPYEWVECRELTPYGIFRKPNWAELYVARLEKIGVKGMHRKLMEISGRHGGKGLVILCYEDVLSQGDHVCHRRVFAQWWFDRTGQVVEELRPLLQHPLPPETEDQLKRQLQASLDQLEMGI